MSVQDKPAAISAWIFDWDGIFVDSEMWKAWSYGLGICEVWEDFERLEASRFDRVVPAASDPFLRVCGRFVGRSREEYLEGLIEYYDLCGYDFNNWLVQDAPRLAAERAGSDRSDRTGAGQGGYAGRFADPAARRPVRAAPALVRQSRPADRADREQHHAS